jgi:hypothetical protein
LPSVPPLLVVAMDPDRAMNLAATISSGHPIRSPQRRVAALRHQSLLALGAKRFGQQLPRTRRSGVPQITAGGGQMR